MNENNKSFLNKAYEHKQERDARYLVTDDHSRATFHIADETIERINDICSYMEVLSGIGGVFSSERVEDYSNHEKYRKLAKGFKSTIVNMALDNIITDFEKSHGKLPKVDRVRFMSSDKTYHRAFKIVDDENVYFSELDNRGNELLYFSNTVATELFATSEEIEKLFNQRLKLAGKFEDEVIEDVPTKRSILDELEM